MKGILKNCTVHDHLWVAGIFGKWKIPQAHGDSQRLQFITVFSFVLIGQHWSRGMTLRRFFPKVESLWGYRQRISVHLPKAARENLLPPTNCLLKMKGIYTSTWTSVWRKLGKCKNISTVHYNSSWAQSAAILSVSLRSICFRLPNSATPYGLMEVYYIIFKRNASTYFIVADYFKKKKKFKHPWKSSTEPSRRCFEILPVN